MWRAPHLSLFLLSALWAGLVPLIWLWPDIACDPVAWHRQELVLGFAAAAMGGYLLTALPHWLKQAGAKVGGPSRGGTVTLVAAWGIGRLAGGSCQPDAMALAGLALYPLALTFSLVAPILRAGAWARLPIALAPLLLVLIAVRLRLAFDSLTAVLGMALLCAVVGGRIIPAFLAARAGSRSTARQMPWEAHLANGALTLALVLHLTVGDQSWIGVLLVIAAFGQAARPLRWDLAPATKGQHDLLMLLYAWAWLPLGLGLVGVGLLNGPSLPLATAVHALTMGLMGSMIFAVMARSWMRREPGRLGVDGSTAMAFALLQSAVALRLAMGEFSEVPAILSWTVAWAIAAAHCVASLTQPVPHPILSAARGGHPDGGATTIPAAPRVTDAHR